MEIENARFIGAGLMVLTSLLGAYYLVLKIRELHSEKPDPKLTYVTYSHMEKVRAEIMHCISDAVQDLRSLRSEIREETRSMQKQFPKHKLSRRPSPDCQPAHSGIERQDGQALHEG